MSKFRILARVEPDGLPFEVKGREAWALDNLVQAGKQGCTPIDHPGPRWSAYVHKLRHKCGLVIETVEESHGGPYAGTHARYVIHSQVTVIAKEGKAA